MSAVAAPAPDYLFFCEGGKISIQGEGAKVKNAREVRRKICAIWAENALEYAKWFSLKCHTLYHKINYRKFITWLREGVHLVCLVLFWYSFDKNVTKILQTTSMTMLHCRLIRCYFVDRKEVPKNENVILK